jgi:hypothetical protein
MPSETPVNEPQGPAGSTVEPAVSDSGVKTPEETSAGLRSRWVDYDTHELLQMISDLEDERRWARLREGIWLAVLFHIVLISAITWIPKYVFKVPAVIDPFEAIKERKDLTYLDVPPDALKKLQPKVEIKPVPQRQLIDKQTMQEMNKPVPPAPTPEPAPQAANTTPPPPIPPSPQSQSPVEAPRPQAVPAKPNFGFNQMSQTDQLKAAMRGATRDGSQSAGNEGGGLSMHPGAGAGGLQILSDTQGVDFNSWIHRWYYETKRTWDPLIPDEVNAPILKRGAVMIRFKVLPNGRLMEGSLVLEGRSGDVALDRAAWGALTGSNYPPLPHEFHGPYLELRAEFLYNMEEK